MLIFDFLDHLTDFQSIILIGMGILIAQIWDLLTKLGDIHAELRRGRLNGR